MLSRYDSSSFCHSYGENAREQEGKSLVATETVSAKAKSRKRPTGIQ